MSLTAQRFPTRMPRFVRRPAYRAVVLQDSPKLYLPLSEGSGTSAADASGNGRTGTYTGITLGAAGPIFRGPTAPTFDGSGGYVTVAHHASLSPSGAFTVAAWVYRSAGVAFGRVVFKGGFTSWQMRLGGDGTTLEGGFVDTANADALATIGTAPASAWCFAAFTYDGSTITPVLNGVAGTTVSNTNGPRTSGQDVGIGWDGATVSNLFNGRLAHVAYYDQALSVARLLQLYRVGTYGGT